MKLVNLSYSTRHAAMLGIALLGFAGCTQPTSEEPAEAADLVTDLGAAAADNHPTEGPHHGGLIELGDEEYHAELVHDEAAGTLTIYLLDSAGLAATPVAAKELRINLSHAGSPEQFTLVASSEVSDPIGKSSRFVSTDAALAESLDSEDGEAHLVVTIGGKQFRGEIEHDHDHEGHDH